MSVVGVERNGVLSEQWVGGQGELVAEACGDPDDEKLPPVTSNTYLPPVLDK